MSESQRECFFYYQKMSNGSIIDQLRTTPFPGDLERLVYQDRYVTPELTPPIIDFIRQQENRWAESTSPDLASYPRFTTVNPDRQNTSRRSTEEPAFDGLFFTKEYQQQAFECLIAVWQFVQQKGEELLDLTSVNPVAAATEQTVQASGVVEDKEIIVKRERMRLVRIERKLRILQSTFIEQLKTIPLAKTFFTISQERNQSGKISTKKPAYHSFMVLRNMLSQGLLVNSEAVLTEEEQSLSRLLQTNLHPATFMAMFLALTHDIGNMFFLENDNLQLHALFSANVLYDFMVKVIGLPPMVAYSFAAGVDSHHIYEVAAQRFVSGEDEGRPKISGPEVTAHLESVHPFAMYTGAVLGIADVSTTKNIGFELENLREELMVCLHVENKQLQGQLIQAIILRMKQLDELIEHGRVNDQLPLIKNPNALIGALTDTKQLVERKQQDLPAGNELGTFIARLIMVLGRVVEEQDVSSGTAVQVAVG